MAIDIYDFMQWGNYNQKIQDLANIANQETWSFSENTDNLILKNYLKYTFYKLQEENKVIENDFYCIFNTGLFTSYYEQIFVCGERLENSDTKWKFKGFYTEYELGNLNIGTYPERADYFADPSLLVFDWRLNINTQYTHILDDEDNKTRLPKCVLEAERPEFVLTGAIDNAIKRVMANYKLAVPQHFKGRVQLLLPLCFGKSDVPDLALTLTKMQAGFYQGHTCLTMDMAYNNARLISKPESNWLLPQKIH